MQFIPEVLFPFSTSVLALTAGALAFRVHSLQRRILLLQGTVQERDETLMQQLEAVSNASLQATTAMNKRQADLAAKLITATFSAQTELINFSNGFDDMNQEALDRIQKAFTDRGWDFLTKHGFERPPTVKQITAYVLSKF